MTVVLVALAGFGLGASVTAWAAVRLVVVPLRAEVREIKRDARADVAALYRAHAEIAGGIVRRGHTVEDLQFAGDLLRAELAYMDDDTPPPS